MCKTRNKSFTSDQQRAINAVNSGQNVFITGGAGVGKSYVLKEVINELKSQGKRVIVCAPTGTAAVAIRGATIHRTFNISRQGVIRTGRKEWSISAHNVAVLKKADAVIIDEISMVRMDLFDSVATSIQKAEKSSKRHIQVIVCGDFLQLPPVIKADTVRGNSMSEADILCRYYGHDVGSAYAFQAPGWRQMNFVTVILHEVIRQKDTDFIEHLDMIRHGDTSAVKWFNEHSASEEFKNSTYLFPRNQDAKRLNTLRISEIDAEPRIYQAVIHDEVPEAEMAVPKELSLKDGIRVMSIVNSGSDYYNGSMGTVMELHDDWIMVRFDGHRFNTKVLRHEWQVISYEVKEDTVVPVTIGTYSQFPLQPAYGMTIHKSQGATFEKANIDPSCFGNGQLYVALSRIRDISGLHLIRPIKENYLLSDPAVLDFYDSLTDWEKTEKTEASVKKKYNYTKKTGRPKTERCGSTVTRIPDLLLPSIKDAIEEWKSNPDDTVICALTKEELNQLLTNRSISN